MTSRSTGILPPGLTMTRSPVATSSIAVSVLFPSRITRASWSETYKFPDRFRGASLGTGFKVPAENQKRSEHDGRIIEHEVMGEHDAQGTKKLAPYATPVPIAYITSILRVRFRSAVSAARNMG